MLREANAENLYLITGYTDMRKGLMSLVEIVQSQYNLDPYTDSLFLFCGRNARKLKALYWEGDGFLLMSKSLSSKESKYHWPRNADEARNLTRDQFTWLMQGLSVDQPKVIRKTNEKFDLY
jgi:transposase